MDKSKLSRRDLLALDRTKLANERTFLAYFRTFIVFLSSGFAILKIQALDEIRIVGVWLLVLSPLLLTVGIARFLYVKFHVKRYYDMEEEE